MKIFIILALLSVEAFAKDETPYVQVQGKCEVNVIPDRGTITFTAENQSKNQEEAVKKTTAQINKLKEIIQELMLKDIELKNSLYSVTPIREYEKERYVDKGYRATLGLDVTTSDISRLGEAMMKASKVGIVNVGSLLTFLSLEKSQKEYLKCLDIAADDARQKANQLARKLNFKISEVIALNEVPNIQAPMPNYGERMMKTSSASTQIEAGTHKYSTNIQVTFSIK
jgi:uncharacterized protein YggE